MLKRILTFGIAGTVIGVGAGFAKSLINDSGERLFPELEHLDADGYDVVVRLSYYKRHDRAIFRRLCALTNEMCRLLKEKPYGIKHPAKTQAVASQVSTELRKLESVLVANKQLFDDETLKDAQTFFDNAVYNVMLETKSIHGF